MHSAVTGGQKTSRNRHTHARLWRLDNLTNLRVARNGRSATTFPGSSCTDGQWLNTQLRGWPAHGRSNKWLSTYTSCSCSDHIRQLSTKWINDNNNNESHWHFFLEGKYLLENIQTHFYSYSGNNLTNRPFLNGARNRIGTQFKEKHTSNCTMAFS